MTLLPAINKERGTGFVKGSSGVIRFPGCGLSEAGYRRLRRTSLGANIIWSGRQPKGENLHITDAGEFVAYFERIRARTRRVIERIPRDRIDWTHSEGKFTFADLIRHIGATERYMFAENVRGRKSCYPGHGSELAQGYDEVLRYLDECHRQSIDIFVKLSNKDLLSKCQTPGGHPITVWKWLRAMVEHEIHHRGQIYMMLGILGVDTPPLYGLTEEEVRAASRQAP
jgi:uncharacterized damage-inducible protein DinB